MVIQLHHRPFVIRLDFYIARCPCIIQRNQIGGEKILINLQKNIVDQQIVLTQLLHLSPLLLLLLLRLVAINCPTSAFTLFYNPRPAFLQIIYSLSLPAAILSVLKSLHQSLHCMYLRSAPLSPPWPGDEHIRGGDDESPQLSSSAAVCSTTRAASTHA